MGFIGVGYCGVCVCVCEIIECWGIFGFGFFLASLFCLMVDVEAFNCCSKWQFPFSVCVPICCVFFSSKDKTLPSLM